MNRREALERAGMILGYAVSAPVLSAVMNGCTPKPGANFTPVFFDQHYAAMITELAEIIIPKTDTPGAKDAGVPAFIDQLIKECYSPEDQAKFLDGLKAFNENAKTSAGDSFLDLDEAKRTEYVQGIHKTAVDAAKKGEKRENLWILQMKELTMVGFFLSEQGATQVLQYEAVPGSYKGCVPLAEIGKAWAT